MRALVGLIAVPLVYTAIAQEPAPTMTSVQTEEVKTATARGLALYRAFQANQASAALASAAREKIADFCPGFKYRAVTVTEGDSTAVYFIGVAPLLDSVVFGRHYRVAGSAVNVSSKSCVAIPPATGKKAAGAYVTHLLSDTPTEFHVFESYLHDTPFYVGTRTAVWSVANGEIRLLANRPPQDAPRQPPVDQPVSVNADQASQQQQIFAPLIAKARETYPDARRRFLAGLPSGERFAVVTRLTDKESHFEQVFVAVKSIHDGRIEGRIASNVVLVSGYKGGDAYSFPESEILDWVISKPDGSEEGNVIGKYLDSPH